MPYLLKIFIYFCTTGQALMFQPANIIILGRFMNILDIIILICLIPAIFQGIRKGFISQAISIASVVIGIWSSAKFADIAAQWLAQHITVSEQVHKIVAFAVILVIVFIALGLIGRLLESILNFAFLGWVNKLAGVLFSVLKITLILGLIAVAFNSLNNSFNLVKPEIIADSVLYGPLKELADAIFPYIKNMISLK